MLFVGRKKISSTCERCRSGNVEIFAGRVCTRTGRRAEGREARVGNIENVVDTGGGLYGGVRGEGGYF